jgi:hypothetical protein
MLAELVDAVVGVDTHRDTQKWSSRSQPALRSGHE